MTNIENNTESGRLNALYKRYNLTSEDVFKHKHYKIITRSGIDKIQAGAGVKVSYKLVYAEQTPAGLSVIVKAIATFSNKTIETFGESSPANTTNKYFAAMAEKRAMSRAVLKITGFYELGVFGEDEADDFNKSKQ